MNPTRRPDESMSLITELTSRSLEPSYAAASARRVAEGRAPATSPRSVIVIVAAVLVGFLIAVAALSLRATADVVGRARTPLIAQIEAGREAGDERAAALTSLEREIAAARAAALGSANAAVLERLRALEIVDGVVAVTGPGVVVTLDDAPEAAAGQADPRQGSGFDPGRVSAADLQIVVNGLWAAGAEAISVNGQRLTARAAIRFAGQAILVDFRPLTRPYLVTALGDPTSLASSFGATSAGPYVKALEDNYGIRVLIQGQPRLTCPAAGASALLYARGVADGIPSSTGTATRTTAPSTSSPRRTAATSTPSRTTEARR